MKMQNYLNLILMFLLLAEKIPAQMESVQISLPPTIDSTYQKVGVMNNLPIFFLAAKERLNFPLSWLSGSFTDFESWRVEARKTIKKLLLAEPPEAPFNSKIIGQEDRGSYVANKILLNISGDSRVTGYLLIPKGNGPFPAVLLLHDHGAKFDIGKEEMVKPLDDSPERISSAEEWKDKVYGGRYIGDELARRGYVCFVTDALNWGDRGGAGYDGQQALASNLFNLGMSYAGLIAHEDSRAAHFLATLPEVDSSRVSAMGFSLGSFRAWQVAAMSDDIKSAVCICWLGTIKGLMVAGNNLTRGQSSFTTLHPGLVNYLDYPDVVSVACPKPMLFYNGENDHLFPESVVQEAYKKIRTIWTSQKAGDKLITKFWPVKHEFSLEMQEEAFNWLDNQMNALKEQMK